ncbi:MAG: hypothetical protein HY959_09405 [Ignavibacteriae bacterium]|nr:hypothetical protein [Ignavibacteriota bacterium]
MKKISVKRLPAEIRKWAENFDDFWFHKYVRSLGYTVKEVVSISKKNDDVCLAMKFAVDSIFEKLLYRLANRTFTREAAHFAIKVYESQMLPVTREIIEIDLKLDKDCNYDDEIQDEDEEDDNDADD